MLAQQASHGFLDFQLMTCLPRLWKSGKSCPQKADISKELRMYSRPATDGKLYQLKIKQKNPTHTNQIHHTLKYKILLFLEIKYEQKVYAYIPKQKDNETGASGCEYQSL